MTELREPESPLVLDDFALDAAERAYWKDDGVSRHNLAAAIRVYLARSRPPEEPPPQWYQLVCDPASNHEHPSVSCFGRVRAAPLRGPSPTDAQIDAFVYTLTGIPEVLPA